jgi:FKBP-type peptidyl-prolyl cis-trans isomerase FkpA
VNSQSTTLNTAPVITGTFDSVNTSVLTVAANGTTYTLGTNSQLTSPSAGTWSLNLGGATLTSPVTTVTVTSTDNQGNTQTGTGTITDGTAIINKYLQANNLTATTTADGLNYVITTQGTGALPAIGQTVSVNYSGFLLNSDGTLGTEFDSNTDSQFGHVTPFTFTLGAGQVIAGWDEAFKLLPVGTVAQLIIPSTLAYGTSGSGSSIPPNSILVFNVNVLSVS